MGMPYNTVIFQVEDLGSDGFLAVCDELCFVLQEKTLNDLKDTINYLLADISDHKRKFAELVELTAPTAPTRSCNVNVKYSSPKSSPKSSSYCEQGAFTLAH